MQQFGNLWISRVFVEFEGGRGSDYICRSECYSLGNQITYRIPINTV
jgi:hypothetical protein